MNPEEREANGPHVLTLAAMLAERDRLARSGRTLAFTNGCFDILHVGHVDYLEFARRQADALVVALNSDRSVKENKGPGRPINGETDRATVVGALRSVDYVIIFDDPEPRGIIEKILPDVLVKGEDWAHYVSGRDVVEAHGGHVVLAPLVAGRSTTSTIQRAVELSMQERQQ